jgi:sarcosine oxidase
MLRDRAEIVVVGAGLLGLAAARALTRRGHEIVLLEQASVGHERAGSKGASRIFRLGYTDARYVRMAMDARPLWRELEAEACVQLLAPTGQLTFGAGMDALFRAMSDAGASVQEMPAAEVRERFPGIAVRGDALYEPESAVIDAVATLTALKESVVDVLHDHMTVTGIADDGRQVRVTTDSRVVEAEIAVVCPGPWSSRLLGLDTFATLEHTAYFRTRDDSVQELPIFIEFAEPAAYGLPTRSLNAYKVALHHAGPSVDPDAEGLEPQIECVDAIARVVARLLPDLDPAPLAVETCMYDNTATEDFILERRGNVVIGAGTSGHGFKFGPLLGERLADLATRGS